MIRCDANLQIPVLVTTERSGRSQIYIPDFDMTVNGADYVDACSHAVMYASAIYYYNIECNVKFKLNTTYEDVERMIKNKKSFATFICLTE